MVNSKNIWRLLTTLAVLAALLLAWVLHQFNPNAVDSPLPSCHFRALTGWFCVGCGGTRALHALIHGDPLQALRMNALVVTIVPMAVGLLTWQSGWRPSALKPGADLLAQPLYWIWLLPLFGILRNLPWAPFSWLAPG